MAKARPHVQKKIRRRLIQEAGGKCANPGCSGRRTHLHHIREWAVYETHDSKHMIAICPNCHDDVHHGVLEIDDDTLKRWKGIERATPPADHVYVDPGDSAKLLLGTLAVTGSEGLIAIELGPSNHLSFRLVNGEFMHLTLAIRDAAGMELLRIVEGHVRNHAEEPVTYEHVQGHLRVTAPICDQYLPGWALEKLRHWEPGFSHGARLPLLDVEVIEPGLVRVEGVWLDGDRCIVITKEILVGLTRTGQPYAPLAGAGADTVLQWNGPITQALFGSPSVAPSRHRGMSQGRRQRPVTDR